MDGEDEGFGEEAAKPRFPYGGRGGVPVRVAEDEDREELAFLEGRLDEGLMSPVEGREGAGDETVVETFHSEAMMR